jgi:hypothetical protein
MVAAKHPDSLKDVGQPKIRRLSDKKAARKTIS